jgi:hypothetical protein
MLAGQAPTARAITRPLEVSGSESYPLFVEFTDDKFLDATTMSLQQDVILVQGPHYKQIAQYSGMIPSHNATGTVVLLQYVLAPPKKGWSSANIGTYKITLQQDRITDSDGNTMPRAKIGSLYVTGVAPVFPNIVGTYAGRWNQSADLDGSGGVVPPGTGGPLKNDPPVAGKLAITRQAGSRIFGTFYGKRTTEVHGTLYANGKFTLVLDDTDLDRHLRITGKLFSNRLIGYATDQTKGVFDTAGSFDFRRDVR